MSSKSPGRVRPTALGTTDYRGWERAYLRFQTPEQEIRKFMRRLRRLGADAWPRNAEIVELFCGRGSGLHALERLGFSRIEGIDLSAALLARYSGSAMCYVADCRMLPFPSASKDIAIVQGGLHHLPTPTGDLDRTLREARRVLRPAGRFVAVEPWSTPFLSLVHGATRSALMRRLSGRFDAFAQMVAHEGETYTGWLEVPGEILSALERHFAVERRTIAWGKLMFVGRPR